MLAEELDAKQIENLQPLLVESKILSSASNIEESVSKIESEKSTAELEIKSDKEEPGIDSRWAKNPKFHSIITAFIKRLDEQLVAMDKANQAEDYKELENLGHWLKGAGGTVGFDVFTEPASALEKCAIAEKQRACNDVILVLRQLSKRLVIPVEAE